MITLKITNQAKTFNYTFPTCNLRTAVRMMFNLFGDKIKYDVVGHN